MEIFKSQNRDVNTMISVTVENIIVTVDNSTLMTVLEYKSVCIPVRERPSQLEQPLSGK